MSGGLRLSVLLRALVSLVMLVTAFILLVLDMWLHALLCLAAGWLVNGVLAKLEFHHPQDGR